MLLARGGLNRKPQQMAIVTEIKHAASVNGKASLDKKAADRGKTRTPRVLRRGRVQNEPSATLRCRWCGRCRHVQTEYYCRQLIVQSCIQLRFFWCCLFQTTGVEVPLWGGCFPCPHVDEGGCGGVLGHDDQQMLRVCIDAKRQTMQ